MRTERLELSHLAALEPKSSASTNSATSALAYPVYDYSKAGVGCAAFGQAIPTIASIRSAFRHRWKTILPVLPPLLRLAAESPPVAMLR